MGGDVVQEANEERSEMGIETESANNRFFFRRFGL